MSAYLVAVVMVVGVVVVLVPLVPDVLRLAPLDSGERGNHDESDDGQLHFLGCGGSSTLFQIATRPVSDVFLLPAHTFQGFVGHFVPVREEGGGTALAFFIDC